jgi:hypothetical protein
MKKYIFAVLMILFSVASYASIMSNNSNLGDEMMINNSASDYNIIDYSIPADVIANGIQNSQGTMQTSNEEVAHDYEVNQLLKLAGTGWDLVKGLLLLFYETVKLFLVVFEMRLILWIFIEGVPKMLLKIRDSTADAIMARSKA